MYVYAYIHLYINMGVPSGYPWPGKVHAACLKPPKPSAGVGHQEGINRVSTGHLYGFNRVSLSLYIYVYIQIYIIYIYISNCHTSI